MTDFRWICYFVTGPCLHNLDDDFPMSDWETLMQFVCRVIPPHEHQPLFEMGLQNDPSLITKWSPQAY